MSNNEESNSGLTEGNEGGLTVESNAKFDKKAYQRELMRKKRAAEKAKRERQEIREGGVDASDAVLEVQPLPEAVQVNLTRTDRKFENDRPGYYIFGKETNERACWKCGEGFKTRMELNKFCGPKCKNEWLSDAFGKLRVNA